MLLAFIPLSLAGKFDRTEIDDPLNPGTKIDHYHYQVLEASMQATMSLALWIKLLYFFRIFESTSFLVRIIVRVVIDMRHFLLIMFLTMIAFGDAMRSISTSEAEEH